MTGNETRVNLVIDCMGKISLQERWTQAMSKIPYSLIGYNRYTSQDATVVCEYFRQHAPKHPRLVTILALEEETRDLPPAIISEPTPKRPFTKHDFLEVLKATKIAQPNIHDYPLPWCKVTKDGKIIRFEDANGRIIPEIIWSKSRN